MKKLFLALALLMAGVVAQPLTTTVYAADSKGVKVEWLQDFAKAKEVAKESKKTILLDFTGSDWCPPCAELKKKVFGTPEFQKFAKEKLVLVEVDFPENKKLPEGQQKANDALAEQFKVANYPTLILVDAEGKEVNRIEAILGESAKKFIARLTPLLPKK